MPDLDNLTNRAIRLNRTQPVLEFSEEQISPAAEMVLPEGEALELARFYWQIMRSKYRHLNTPAYDFKNGSIGRGELIWISMADSTSCNQISKETNHNRAL